MNEPIYNKIYKTNKSQVCLKNTPGIINMLCNLSPPKLIPLINLIQTKNKCSGTDIIKIPDFMIDNIFVTFQQNITIPIGTNCVMFLETCFFFYEAVFLRRKEMSLHYPLTLLSATKMIFSHQIIENLTTILYDITDATIFR